MNTPKRNPNVDEGKEVTLSSVFKDVISNLLKGRKSLADEVKEIEELVERSKKQRGSK